MKVLFRLLIAVMFLTPLVVAPSPPNTYAQTPTPTVATACNPFQQSQQQQQNVIRQALETLTTRNPANIGADLAQVARGAGSISFQDFRGTANEGAFALYSITSDSIAINQELACSPPEVIATEIAHEARHRLDRQVLTAIDGNIDPIRFCFGTEMDAFTTHVIVWRDLRTSLVGTPAIGDRDAQVKEDELTFVESLQQQGGNVRGQVGQIVSMVIDRYASTDRCLAPLVNSFVAAIVSTPAGSSPIPSQSEGSVGASSSSSSTTTTPSTPGSTGSTGSSSSSLTPGGMGAVGQSGANPSTTNPGFPGNPTNPGTSSNSGNPGNTGNPSNNSLPNQLPNAGGIPLSAAEITLMGAGLAGAGFGLRRFISR